MSFFATLWPDHRAPATKDRGYLPLLLMAVLMLIVGYAAMTAALTDNITFNINKIYVTLLMASLGVAAELAVMRWPLGRGELVAGGVLLGLSFWLVAATRGQYFVGRRDFLKGMIEHHAMALVMAEGAARRADTLPDERELADSILRSQTREIALMRAMLRRRPTY